MSGGCWAAVLVTLVTTSAAAQSSGGGAGQGGRTGPGQSQPSGIEQYNPLGFQDDMGQGTAGETEPRSDEATRKRNEAPRQRPTTGEAGSPAR